MSGPPGPNDMRFVASMTILPATASAISGAISGALENGVARTTTSAPDAAAALVADTRAPVAAATLPASSGSREAMVTECPARTNAVASERPTLPAPMMAMSMA